MSFENQFSQNDIKGAARVIKNSLFILLSRGVQITSSFFILIAVARYLSVEQYGEYSFLFTFVSSVMLLASFGIRQVLIREIAKDKEKASHIMGAAIRVRTVLAGLAVIILVVSLYAMNLPMWILVAGMLAIASELFLSFSMLSKSIFQAFEKMIYEPLLTLIYCLILAAGVFVVIYFDMGFLWLFVCLAAANLVQFLAASYILSSRFVRPSFTVERSQYAQFIKDSIVIGIGIFFYQNLFRINVLMLKWLGTIEDVSYFYAPHNLMLQLQTVPMSFVMAIFPVLSRLMHSDREKMAFVYEKLFVIMFIGSFFTGIIIFLFSKEIIEIVFGSKYSRSVFPLMIMSWAMVPLTMDMFFNGVLISINKQKYSIIYAGAALVLNFVAAFFFIPLYGFIAAAYISVFSYTFLFLCSMYFLWENGLSIKPKKTKTMLKTILIGSVGGTAIYLLKTMFLSPFAVAALIIFFGSIYVVHVFKTNDLSVFMKEIKNIRMRKL